MEYCECLGWYINFKLTIWAQILIYDSELDGESSILGVSGRDESIDNIELYLNLIDAQTCFDC